MCLLQHQDCGSWSRKAKRAPFSESSLISKTIRVGRGKLESISLIFGSKRKLDATGLERRSFATLFLCTDRNESTSSSSGRTMQELSMSTFALRNKKNGFCTA